LGQYTTPDFEDAFIPSFVGEPDCSVAPRLLRHHGASYPNSSLVPASWLQNDEYCNWDGITCAQGDFLYPNIPIVSVCVGAFGFFKFQLQNVATSLNVPLHAALSRVPMSQIMHGRMFPQKECSERSCTSCITHTSTSSPPCSFGVIFDNCLVKSLVYTPTFDRHIANCPGILHAKSIEGLPFTGEYYPYNLPYLHTLYASNSCCNMMSVSDDFFPFRSAVKRSGLTFDANTWLLPQFYPSLQYLYARGLL
jgi:hypothetical protein